jgi:hypothetical protein
LLLAKIKGFELSHWNFVISLEEPAFIIVKIKTGVS